MDEGASQTSEVTGLEAYRASREYPRKWLRRAGYDPDTMHGLLDVVRVSEKPTQLLNAFELLGAERFPDDVVPRLIDLCMFRSEEVQISALNAVVRTLGLGAIPVLRRLAGERACRVKWALYFKICRYGSREDAPLVAEYVRGLVRRGTRSGLTGIGTTLSEYCAFLDEFLGVEPCVAKLYEWLRARWERLDRVDRQILERRQPFFRRGPGQRWVLMVVGPGIVGDRLANVLYREGGRFGLMRLNVDAVRFRSAFPVFALWADVVVAVGEEAERGAREVMVEAEPRRLVRLTVRYEALRDPVVWVPRDISHRAWQEIAAREDEEHVRVFREMLAGL